MRILVSKPDSLGDQLIISGLIQALAVAHPTGLVVWHVRSGIEDVASILDGVSVFIPNIGAAARDEIRRFETLHPRGVVMLPYPLHPFAEWTSETERLLAWWEAFLSGQTWDAAVAAVTNRTWVAEVTVASSHASVRVGAEINSARQVPVNAAGHLLARQTPTFTREVAIDVRSPEVASLGRLISAIDLLSTETPRTAMVRVPATDQSHAPRTALLAPGVGGPLPRAWPARHFIELATRLHAANWDVVWIEGPSDAPFFDEIRRQESTVIRTFQRGQLPELASLVKQSAVFVCNDTAYAHLAALLDTPTVAVYGGGQGKRFHPQIGRVKVVQGLPPCAGCQWHCLFENYPCVSSLPVETVYCAVEELLANQDTRPVPVVPVWPPERTGPDLLARMQDEILRLDADRFARLQIIQTLLDQLRRPAAVPPPAPASPPPAASPSPPSPHLSVVVPMGRPERALPTLDALAKQDSPAYLWEVVVAGAGETRIPHGYPGLKVRRALMNASGPPSQTRNAGVALASGEWLLFVDDDIQLAPDFLVRAEALIRDSNGPTQGSTRVGALGARLPGRTGGFWEGLTDFSNFWSQQSLLPRECQWLYSAALLVRAQAFSEIGGFDPDLAVGEDVDLCRRLVQHGYTLRYEPSLVAYHDHQRDTPVSMWRYFWRNGEGAKFFFRALGGACPFSVKTVWLKTWSDLRLNQAHQKTNGGRLGWRTPLIWLNYLIVETSLEFHWQRHLRQGQRYLSLPVRARSDITAVRAMTALDGGRRLKGSWLYALAVMQDFSNPLRR